MLHQDKAQAGVAWEVFQELGESFQATSGSADARNRRGCLIAVFGADTFSPALFPAVFAFFPDLLTGVLLPLTPIPFPCDSTCSPRQIGYR